MCNTCKLCNVIKLKKAFRRHVASHKASKYATVFITTNNIQNCRVEFCSPPPQIWYSEHIWPSCDLDLWRFDLSKFIQQKFGENPSAQCKYCRNNIIDGRTHGACFLL